MQGVPYRPLLAALCLFAFSAAVPAIAAQADYPSRPVRMIVPFAPGGASDFVARIMEPKLAQQLGQSVVIDNRTGASGYVGIEVASQAPPDGYTILLGNIGTMAINDSVFPKFAVKPLNAFDPVTQVVDVPGCVVVHPSLPVYSLKELIAYIKARPGQLDYSAAGAGSNSRLAFEYFLQQAGLKAQMVPDKGGASGASLAVVTGEVPMTMLTSASVLPYVQQNRLRLLAVIAPERLEVAPEVPTMAEAGFPDLTVGSWQGVYIPKGTPRPVVDRLFDASVKTMQDQEVKRRLATASAMAVVSRSPEDFRQFWEREHKRWSKVVQDIGAAAQR
jgi:tripartite-type tricarboxylate transporter receptor subunit TctC